MQVSLNNFEAEAASQLVLGQWPLLETLMVSFKLLDEHIIKMLLEGKWPMLKELQIDIVPFIEYATNKRLPGWNKEIVQHWQTVEDHCRSRCENRWQCLEALYLPHSDNIRETGGI